MFILMGESNMLGFGRVAPEDQKRTLKYLIKKDGKYLEFKGNVKAIDARPFWRDKSVFPSGAGFRNCNSVFQRLLAVGHIDASCGRRKVAEVSAIGPVKRLSSPNRSRRDGVRPRFAG